MNPWRKALLVVHIASSAGLIGAATALAALGASGMRGAEARAIYPAMHLIEAQVIAFLSILALATGVTLALAGRWGLLRHRWVTIKLVITAGLTAVVFAVLEPALADFHAVATAGESLTDAQRLRAVLFPSVAVALLLLNVALGVFKPGRPRMRPGSRHP